MALRFSATKQAIRTHHIECHPAAWSCASNCSLRPNPRIHLGCRAYVTLSELPSLGCRGSLAGTTPDTTAFGTPSSRSNPVYVVYRSICTTRKSSNYCQHDNPRAHCLPKVLKRTPSTGSNVFSPAGATGLPNTSWATSDHDVGKSHVECTCDVMSGL